MSLFHTRVALVKAPSFLSRLRFFAFFTTCLGLLILGVGSAMASNLIFLGDFETGTLSQYSAWDKIWCCEHSGAVVKGPVRAGRFALRTELRRSDPDMSNSKRAEIRQPRHDPVGSERWYGFSTYFPADWVNDTAPELIAQWHSTPDPNEPWISPPLQLDIVNDQMKFLLKWDPRPFTPDNHTPSAWLEAGPLRKGVWIDWVVHVKWSYRDDGILQVWRNGQKIIDRRGPNCYNNRAGIFFKFGLYKWPWKDPNTESRATVRVVYHDEVRIGDASATYYDVAPGIEVSLLDTDRDGLTNRNELDLYGTDPHLADTDSDGLEDGDEVHLWGNDWDADFDDDGLINLLDPDSDGDGLLDGKDNNALLPVRTVSARAWQAPNVPTNTLDGNLNTRWSADGTGQWITYDLEAQRMVSRVAIAWHQGNQRRATFAIQVSLNGMAWTEVYRGTSSGTTLSTEAYAFKAVAARYVRIVGYGNTVNQWNSITEGQIYGQ